ncbi:putative xyloglucan galactosyltransferase KATAMARI1 -like protein [Capsicum annuum]|nr:putative xyloglucan galactosyltransferase KATAMARI1 -like protein [Capsicum annuum]
MEISGYQTRAELLLRNYMLSDSFVIYSSVIGGIFACKLVYDLSQIFTSIYFKCYAKLSKSQQVEWNNRSVSTVHAILVTTMSLYLAFWSDLFSDNQLSGPVIMRSSTLSTFVLGVSMGYFLTDLAMILWFYPSLGGLEYVSASCFPSIFLVKLLLAIDIPFMLAVGSSPSLYGSSDICNVDRYLDVAGMKKSKAYLVNGFMMVFAWLVKHLPSFAIFLLSVVPLILTVMNLVWFWKIVKGLKKTLVKRQLGSASQMFTGIGPENKLSLRYNDVMLEDHSGRGPSKRLEIKSTLARKSNLNLSGTFPDKLL